MLYNVRMNITCADPGIFQGGGGPGQSDKKSSDNVFFLSSAYSSDFKENYHFSRFQGGPTFSRGGGGSNCLFPIESHITCDFPGGVRTPCPPSGSALV